MLSLSVFVKGGNKESSSAATTMTTLEPMIVPTTTILTQSPTQQPVTDMQPSMFYPTDAEATFFCGNDWIHTNVACLVQCPSAKNEDCPSCFIATACTAVGGGAMEEDEDGFDRIATYLQLTALLLAPSVHDLLHLQSACEPSSLGSTASCAFSR